MSTAETTELNYQVIDLPAPDPRIVAAFDDLVLDEFTGGNQRFRRFSQYRMTFSDDTRVWASELLPHRPFVQAPDINSYVGGVPRDFLPLMIDPSVQLDLGAQALGLDVHEAWQVNVHQCRVIATETTPGISVPEGPHRDGHDYGMLVVFGRKSISGGRNQLLPTGGGEPFFEVTLEANQALVYDDHQMWHNATDLVATDPGGGHRDLWIVAFNRWDRRKYGFAFEQAAVRTGP